METLSFWLIRYLNELGQLTESDIFTSTLWPVYLQSTWWSFKWEVIKEPHESQGKESCASFQALKIQSLIVGFVTFTCFSLTVLKVLVIYSDSTTSTTTTATSNSINNDHVHHDRMFSTLFLLADPLSCTTHVQISRAHTYSKTLHRGIFRSVKKSVSLLQTMVMFAMSSPYFFMFQLISCLSLTGCVQTTRLNTDGVLYIHNISPLLCVNINAYYWRKKNDSYCLSAIDFM